VWIYTLKANAIGLSSGSSTSRGTVITSHCVIYERGQTDSPPQLTDRDD
jgi:hypothetical protein